MPAALLSEDELRRRRPLWVALSDLFLDTELGEADFRRIAWHAATSGYGDDEIGHILWNEVAPVVGANLLTVAGEWALFDEDWLCGRAVLLAGRHPRPSLTRFLARRLIASDWQRVLALLPLARQAQAAAPTLNDPDAYVAFTSHTTPPA